MHDIIEGEGDNRTVFSVDGIRAPSLQNGTYLVDLVGALDEPARFYVNRNLTWVDRLTPFRVLLILLPKQPKDLAARHLYGTQLLRAWYGTSRMLERSALVLISLDGAVEVVV